MNSNGSRQPAPCSSGGDVIAALVTPCGAEGVVDPAGMTQLTRNLSQNGCAGLFALSSTGEMVLVDEDDRRKLTVSARDGTPDGVELLLGVGGFGPKQSLRYARCAAADGADVAVVMAPFFQRLSQAELLSYVERIADQSPIPVGLYHHLRMTTVFEVDTVARLAEHQNIVLCKDTSGDHERMRLLVQATRGSGMRLLQGSELLFLSSLEVGAHGCISALAGIAPEWHRRLIDAFHAGHLATAQDFQQRLAQLLDIFRLPEVRESLAHFVHTLKYAAACRGWLDSTASLLPGFEPSAEFDKAIHAILQEVGLLAPQEPLLAS